MGSYFGQKFQFSSIWSSSSSLPEEEEDDEEHEEQKEADQELEQKEREEQKRNEIERSKIKIMRAHLQTQDPSTKDVDDLMLRRFLRARDLDVDKASALFLKYLSWRKEFVPNGSISPSEIPNELAHDKLFMQGQDKLGRPIVVVFGGRHKPQNLEEFKCFVTFSLDKICARMWSQDSPASWFFGYQVKVCTSMSELTHLHKQVHTSVIHNYENLHVVKLFFLFFASSRMPSGQEKFVCIGDLEGWGYASSDVRGYLAALSILQDCYPERLGKLFIVHMPYIFMTAWKMVYPFIDSKTKKKIIFVEGKKLRSTLLNDIEESQLPETYGGKLPLIPIKDC